MAFPRIISLLLFFTMACANFSLNPFTNDDNACIHIDSDLTNNSVKNQNIRKNNGKVYYAESFRFKNATAVASFSTFFSFQIDASASQCPGDGMAFFIQADPRSTPYGARLGIEGNSSNRFIAVEFDTYINDDHASHTDSNIKCGRPSSGPAACSRSCSHVGIDLDDMNSFRYACYPNLLSGTQRAWIDFDAQSQVLELRITNENDLRPSEAIVTAQNVDLQTVFSNDDYLHVGLSASTGAASELHIIYSWSFNITHLENPLSAPPPYSSSSKNNTLRSPYSRNNTLSPYSRNNTLSPSKKVTLSVTLIIIFVVIIFTSVLITCLICIKRAKTRKKRHETLPQISELEIPLPRYSFADLSIATKRFSKNEMLGKGGYGTVYKGILPSDGSMVAVKVMAAEGLNQFLAELSVIGRLKHKNLVALKGWCYEQEKLILVYNFMPNGSLDQHLFSSEKMLSWSKRYEIVKGIAEGLLFLHAGWEQRIVHRDIKAANVLLDSKFGARLGDFGLSKLMENNKTQQTMTQAGTWGYIAPELAYMGRANEKSDIYSFGILLLEIACGKSVLNFSYEAQEYDFLWDWVWQAHLRGNLLGLADVRLNSEYDQDEMRIVLCLGLLCSHPDADMRPSMRKCCQILNSEAVLPDLPNSKPTMFFGDRQLNSVVLSQSKGSIWQSSGISSNFDRCDVPLMHLSG